MNINNSQENFIPKSYQSLDLQGIQKSQRKIIETENNIIENYLDDENDSKEHDENIINIFEFSNNKYDSISDDEDGDSRYYTKSNTDPKKKKIFQLKKVQRIFSIQKKEKNGRKKGRLPLNRHRLNTPKHNKNSLDNIATKIKVHFVKKTLKYINKKFNEFLLQYNRKKKILLMNIKPNSYNIFSKKANQIFVNLKIYQLFSADLTNRITGFPKDYNRTQIKSLFEKNEATEVINIMNSSVKEMYEIYRSNEITDYNLESDLNEISEKNDEEKSNDEKEEGYYSNDDEIEEDEKGEEKNVKEIEEERENEDEEEKGEEDRKNYKDMYKNIAEKFIDLLNGEIKRKNL